MKSPQQILAELDSIFSQPNPPATLYFVDDNFIGNRKAAQGDAAASRRMAEDAIDYPLMFACEATLNIAKQTDILELMREADFVTMFVGIETPEADALDAHQEGPQRRRADDGVDQDPERLRARDHVRHHPRPRFRDADTEQRLKDFIDLSQIPMLTINLLQALPKTPLWDRLKRDGRLLDDDSRESNVVFLRPHDEVVGMWRRAIAYANDPEKLFERFRHQVEATYANRKVTPAKGKLTLEQPARRRRDGVARLVASPPQVGFPQAVLAHGQARAEARPDRRPCSARRSWATT